MRVPVYERRVPLSPIPSARVIPAIPKNNGGDTIGKGLQDLAGIMLKIQNDTEDARVLELFNKFKKDSLEYHENPDNGIYNTRVLGNAQGVYSESDTWLRETGEDYVKQLKSDRSKKNFRTMAEQYIQQRGLQNSRFEATQIKKYRDEQADATYKMGLDSITTNPYDDDLIAQTKKEMEAALELKMRGASPEAWKNAIAEMDNTIASSRLEKMIQDDPIKAEKWFNEHKDQFKGDTLVKAEKLVKDKSQIYKTQAIADELIRIFPPDRSENNLPQSLNRPLQKPKKGTPIWSGIVKGTESSGYGMRNGKHHDGIDIAAKAGDEILMKDFGGDFVVKKSVMNNPYTGYGCYVDLEGNVNGHIVGLKFAHMGRNTINVDVGQRVSPGTLIGKVGNTGRTGNKIKGFSDWNEKKNYGYHLHFEISVDGKKINPNEYYEKISVPRSQNNISKAQATPQQVINWIREHYSGEEEEKILAAYKSRVNEYMILKNREETQIRKQQNDYEDELEKQSYLTGKIPSETEMQELVRNGKLRADQAERLQNKQITAASRSRIERIINAEGKELSPDEFDAEVMRRMGTTPEEYNRTFALVSDAIMKGKIDKNGLNYLYQAGKLTRSDVTNLLNLRNNIDEMQKKTYGLELNDLKQRLKELNKENELNPGFIENATYEFIVSASSILNQKDTNLKEKIEKIRELKNKILIDSINKNGLSTKNSFLGFSWGNNSVGEWQENIQSQTPLTDPFPFLQIPTPALTTNTSQDYTPEISNNIPSLEDMFDVFKEFINE